MRITKKQVEVWIKNVAELTGRPVSNYDKTKDTYIVNSLYLDSYAPNLYNVYEIIDSKGCVNQFASGKLSDILEYLRAYYLGYKDALKNNENHPQAQKEGN